LRPGAEGKQFLFQIVLTVGLFLSITFVPLVGLFAGLLTPTPAAIAVLRWGFSSAWLVPACSALFGSLILYLLGLSYTIPYLLALVSMGVLIGYGLGRRWSTEKIVGFSSLIVIGLVVFVLVLVFAESGGEVIRLIEEDLRGVLSAAFKDMGSSSIEYQGMESKILETVPLIVRIMPGVFISSILAISWLNLLVSRRYCRITAGELCLFEELTLWRSPEPLVWLVIAAGLMVIFPLDDLKLVGVNLLIVTGTIYFFQGLAIVAFYFAKWKLPFFAKGLIYILMFLQLFTSIAVAILGLFDIWFDFRKLTKKPA